MPRLGLVVGLIPCVLLAGCHRRAADPPAVAAVTVPCALAGAAFARDCEVERLASPAGETLVVRHPDGGFRTLLVTTDGRGIVAAAGAAPARVTVIAGGIEVAIGDDRYRLPATIEPAGRPMRK